jgi:hypothetical protein
MNRDKIQQLAKDAGLPLAYISVNGVLNWTDLERFTALVLEEAAKVCESRWGSVSMFAHSRDAKANNEAVESCARAIRAMKPEVKL